MSGPALLSARAVPDLVRRASRRGVGDGPRRLLPGPKLRLLQDLDQDREDVGVDHRLLDKDTGDGEVTHTHR